MNAIEKMADLLTPWTLDSIYYNLNLKTIIYFFPSKKQKKNTQRNS